MPVIIPKAEQMSFDFGQPRTRWTFDNFAHGPTNLMAYSLAQRIGATSVAYSNVSTFYGGPSCGKTHLIHAIARARAEHEPDSKILCTTARQFLVQFTNCVRFGKGLDFNNHVQDFDLILIDGVEFLAEGDKSATVEEFAHLIEWCVTQDKQIVLTINQSPGSLVSLPEDARSLIQSGPVLRIEPSTQELRRQIISAHHGKRFDNTIGADVIDFFTREIVDPRKLLGMMQTLAVATETCGHYVDLERAEQLLGDQIRKAKQVVTFAKIVEVVCKHLGIKEQKHLLDPGRKANLVHARRIVAYLAKETLGASYSDIGRQLKRDHSSIMKGFEELEKLFERDLILKADVDGLRRLL